MEGEKRRSPLRSFALGGLVGAAGAIAAVRRLKAPARSPRSTPAGLAAFEDAPCFREVVGGEAKGHRGGSGADTSAQAPGE